MEEDGFFKNSSERSTTPSDLERPVEDLERRLKFAGTVENVMNVFRGPVVVQCSDFVPVSARYSDRILALVIKAEYPDMDFSTYLGLRCLSVVATDTLVLPPSLNAFNFYLLSGSFGVANVFEKLERSGSISTVEHLKMFVWFRVNNQFPEGASAASLRSVFIRCYALSFEILSPLFDYPALEVIACREGPFFSAADFLQLQAKVATKKPDTKVKLVLYDGERFKQEWLDIVKPIIGWAEEKKEDFRFLNVYY